MTSRLIAVVFDAHDPQHLASFWSGVLGWEMTSDDDIVTLVPTDDTGFQIDFAPTHEQKTGQNSSARIPV